MMDKEEIENMKRTRRNNARRNRKGGRVRG